MRKLYLDPNLQIMFGVTLMIIMGVSSIMPVLPRITVELGVPASAIGLVITVFALPGVILAPIVGILADRIGRKKILVASLLVFGVFGTACGFARTFDRLLLFRFFQGMGMAPLGILNATVVGDLYEGAERLTAMGYIGAVLSMGTAAFPALGGGLAMIGWQYPFMLPVVAIPLGLLVHFFLKNPEPPQPHGLKDYMKGALSIIWTRKAIGLFLLTLFTFVILYGPLVTYVPLVLHDRFGISAAMIGMLMATSSLFTGLAASQLGRLSSRTGEILILRIACILFLVSMVSIPLVPSVAWFLVPLALFGGAMGMGSPTRITMITGLASTDQRAAVMSVNSMVQRLGQTAAPVLMGAVLAGLGMDSVFWVGAAVAVCMAGATILVEK